MVSTAVAQEAAAGVAGQATADATIELDDFQIRLSQQIQAGPQVCDVTDIGDEPHERLVTKTPELLAVELAQQLVQMDPESGEIPESPPDPSTFAEAGQEAAPRAATVPMEGTPMAS